MGELAERIRRAIAAEEIIVSPHAVVRLRQRHVPVWQAVAATLDGRVIAEHRRATPNPKIEADVLLADGAPAKAVWSWIDPDSSAKLVTIPFYTR